MGLFPDTPPFDTAERDAGAKGGLQLGRQLFHISDFFRRVRVQMRFGELTRAPLKLLSFQINHDDAECTWIARPPDKWDAHLPRGVGQKHASLQAIKDAMDVRELLFATLPEVDHAQLKVYRQQARRAPELIITGYVERADRPARNIRSLAMRANLLGFRFHLENGILEQYTEDTLKVGT